MLPPVNRFQQQAVNRQIFQTVFINAVKSRSPTVSAPNSIALSTEEDNAIRYASGYVSMKVFKR